MTQTLDIVGLSGSLRRASYNSALLRAAAALAPEGLTIDIVDWSDLPVYNGDLETNGLPAPAEALRGRIRRADGLLIATPEYNYGVPGPLKNAIDWVSRPPDHPFAGKPLGIMGGGGGFGTARGQLQVRQTMAALNCSTMNKPEVYVSNIWDKFDDAGQLTDDALRTALTGFLTAFAAWCRRLKG